MKPFRLDACHASVRVSRSSFPFNRMKLLLKLEWISRDYVLLDHSSAQLDVNHSIHKIVCGVSPELIIKLLFSSQHRLDAWFLISPLVSRTSRSQRIINHYCEYVFVPFAHHSGQRHSHLSKRSNVLIRRRSNKDIKHRSVIRFAADEKHVICFIRRRWALSWDKGSGTASSIILTNEIKVRAESMNMQAGLVIKVLTQLRQQRWLHFKNLFLNNFSCISKYF